MDLTHLGRLKENLCKEIEKYAEKRGMTASDLDIVYKLTDSIKNIGKIEMLEEGEFYDDEYARGMSGARGMRRGEHYVRGHYSRDGYDDRMSRNTYGTRRYSYASAKDEMMEHLGEMMKDANEHEREILKEAMRNLEKA